MKVSGVAPSSFVPDTTKVAPKQPEVAQPQSVPKKDSAILSAKAKDIAAARAGKSMQDEASESLSAKEQEAE